MGVRQPSHRQSRPVRRRWIATVPPAPPTAGYVTWIEDDLGAAGKVVIVAALVVMYAIWIGLWLGVWNVIGEGP